MQLYVCGQVAFLRRMLSGDCFVTTFLLTICASWFTFGAIAISLHM